MTDAEREALVEAMAEALWRHALGFSISDANRFRDYWREKARAALAVAEPAIRADEREACAREADHYAGHSYSAKHIAAAIRARGDKT